MFIFNKKLSFDQIFPYVVLIPFLHPRGFDEISVFYKKFFTIWLYISLVLIVLYFFLQIKKEGSVCDFIKKIFFNINILSVSIYFFGAILITFLVRDNVTSGLQFLFAFPLITFFIIIYGNNNFKILIKVTYNIILINLMLNITLFNPILFTFIFNIYHLTFLGHVQLISQVSLLALSVAFIGYHFKIISFKKLQVMIFVSILNLLFSNTDVGILILLFLCMATIFRKFKITNYCLDNCAFITIAIIIINFLTVLFLGLSNIDTYIPFLSFSGRSHIWNQALQLFCNSPLFGYGIDGVLINVFWGSSFNYGHNQIIQNLLDGGIILLLLFFSVLFQLSRSISDIKNKGLKWVLFILFISYLLIMMVESVSIYCYFYMFVGFIVLYCKKFDID